MEYCYHFVSIVVENDQAHSPRMSTRKTAIILLSDPNSGSDEALGRAFNAMAFALDLKQRELEVALLFQGAGTRWIKPLSDAAHPLHALFEAVVDRVEGVCGGCADVFHATPDLAETALPIRRELELPGTSGLTSIGRYVVDGYDVVTF